VGSLLGVLVAQYRSWLGFILGKGGFCWVLKGVFEDLGRISMMGPPCPRLNVGGQGEK